MWVSAFICFSFAGYYADIDKAKNLLKCIGKCGVETMADVFSSIKSKKWLKLGMALCFCGLLTPLIFFCIVMILFVKT